MRFTVNMYRGIPLSALVRFTVNMHEVYSKHVQRDSTVCISEVYSKHVQRLVRFTVDVQRFCTEKFLS